MKKAIMLVLLFLVFLFMPCWGDGRGLDSAYRLMLRIERQEAKADSTERAAARTDAKFNVDEFMQTLDSLVAETHVDFTKKYKLKIASLISMERTDRQLRIEAIVELIAQYHAKLIVAIWDNDAGRIDELCRELDFLQIQLIDATVKLRNIKGK